MNNLILALYVRVQNLVNREEGQDLVEYALLCSLIALTLIGGMKTVATAVSTVFNSVSSSLS